MIKIWIGAAVERPPQSFWSNGFLSARACSQGMAQPPCPGGWYNFC